VPARGARTSPDALRQEIYIAELAVAALRPGADRQQVLGLLQHLDRIDQVFAGLEARQVDLRAERARIETIHNMILSRGPIVAHALAGEWDPLRAEVQADRTRWWWYLDQRVAADRSRQRRKAGWIATGAVLALGILAAVYLLFLQPDEVTRRRIALVSQAEGLVEEGAYAEAMALYEQAEAVAPEDPDLPLAVAVLHEALGEPADADEAYGRARVLYGDEAVYWAYRSGRYLSLGWWAEGASAAQQAIALDPDLALAYCHLAGAYEAQGQIDEATAAVRRCRDLAQQHNQDELYVLATSRLARLLQMPR
jgi:tetratricopeptide (TPR) repeat protein